MDWTFREDAEPQGSSNGFWYDLTDGGYVKPEEVLADEAQLRKLNEAIAVIRSFEGALVANELLNEF